MRRQYITHPQFQISFTLSFVIGVSLIFLILGGSVVGTLFLLSKDPVVSSVQQSLLLQGVRDITLLVGFQTILFCLFFVFVGIYLSYKFVGPLLRLESWLENEATNEGAESFKLRPGDELNPVLIALQRVLKKLIRR